jgi:hypothetical protein
MGTAEIAENILLHIATLLLADDHAAVASDTAYTCRHRLVVAEKAVAVEFHEVGHAGIHIIQKIRTRGVAGDLDALPGCQVAVECLAFLIEILAGGDQQWILGAALLSEIGHAAFEIGNREFKVEGLDIHGKKGVGVCEKRFSG